MILLDLSNPILPHHASNDLMDYRFYSPQTQGPDVELIVAIRSINDPLLPNVYNIGFGPSDGAGGIDDKANLKHTDRGRVFSTIIVFAMAFLQQNAGSTIGIDGSDERRAYLYHRMFQSNYEALKDSIVITGVDWYVKLLRNRDVERDANGNFFFKPRPEPFDFQRKSIDLYRYYLIDIKE